MIKPGKMNKRVMIQQPAAGTPAQNAFGEKNISWTTFDTVWAAVEPIQGREFWAQQQVQSDVTIRVRIRYLSGVNSTMRVLYGSRILTFKSVIDPKEAHKEMHLMCSEGLEES